MTASVTYGRAASYTTCWDTIETMPTEIASPHAEMMAALQNAEGESFDTAYVQNQATAHETAVALYQAYAEGGDNEALMAYAQESLPVLQQHLEHVQEMGQ